MATLILEIPNKKLKFIKAILSHFTYVNVQEPELDEDTDEEVIANIRQGVEEMRLVEQGKMKSTPFKEFLKELDEL